MRGEKQKGPMMPKSMHRSWVIELGFGQTSRTACVRACVRVLKSSCEERVRLCVSIRARGDTSPGAAFFSSHKWRRMRARSSPLTNSLSTDTHRKKKILAFFPPPRHDLVVSWGSLGVLFGVRVLLIERTYLNSCLRLVRTKLSSRAYVFLPLFVHACACVCAWTLCTCSLFLFVYVTLKFRVAKYLVSSHRYAIFSLS